MQADIGEHIRTCEPCRHFKTPTRPKYGLLQPIKVSQVFEQLHIDTVGLVKVTAKGNRYIVTAIDASSRFAHAKPKSEV